MLYFFLDQIFSFCWSFCKNIRDFKLDININIEYFKIVRKGGGYKGININNNKKCNVMLCQ